VVVFPAALSVVVLFLLLSVQVTRLGWLMEGVGEMLLVLRGLVVAAGWGEQGR